MSVDRDTIARQKREIVALQRRIHNLESRDPKVVERVVRKEIRVPGPVRYRDVVKEVQVPGPVREKVVTREVPGPVRYIEKPGPERIRTKVERVESPKTAELERENARLRERNANLRRMLERNK